jgi:hypothetical protein
MIIKVTKMLIETIINLVFKKSMITIKIENSHKKCILKRIDIRKKAILLSLLRSISKIKNLEEEVRNDFCIEF